MILHFHLDCPLILKIHHLQTGAADTSRALAATHQATRVASNAFLNLMLKLTTCKTENCSTNLNIVMDDE